MRKSFRTTVVSLLTVFAFAACSAAEVQVPPKVAAVIKRSKTTRAAYSLYTWIWLHRPDGTTGEEWAAEFNNGPLHRVETPRDRVVANCETMTGSAFSLVTGQILTGPEVAKVACGISTAVPFSSAEWQGAGQTAFGAADAVQVAAGGLTKSYVVNGGGVIVRATLTTDGPRPTVLLRTISTSLLPKLPSPNMFSDESLKASFVPDAYKVGPTGHRWPDSAGGVFGPS